jgi:hypothetical protein
MEREDVLVRPNDDVPFAPFSVYLDVSPTEANGVFAGVPSSFVSDTFRVWELLDDCHNLSTAKARLDMYRIDPEFEGQVIKIYANETGWWISDHPVFSGGYREQDVVRVISEIDNDSKI